MELQVINPETVGSKCKCETCGQTFTVKASLVRHLKQNICKQPILTRKDQEAINKELETIKQERDMYKANHNEILQAIRGINNIPIFNAISDVPSPIVLNNNQNLNVLCLGSKDNLLDILSNKEGLPKALEYLKDCALAKLAGDCRILERVYQLETDQPVIMYLNQSKTKYVYYDDRRRRTVETNAKVMAKKLADILQRSYLKGMTCFKTDLADNERDDYLPTQEVHGQDKMPGLAPYDMQNWNEHVHLLSDEKYQKKVLTSMKIPIETGRE